jgi:RNA polymerase sigma-70 factor, ECF subfamily
MDASVTFRLLPLAVPTQNDQTSGTPTAQSPERETNDEALMLQVREGSREALAVLFRRYARIVRGIAYRVLRDPSEADDLLQDIFLLIHRLCTTFDSSKGSARFWILQMTYRRAISRWRYLTSRHFYQCVDIDDLTEKLGDPQADVERLDDSIDGVLRAGALEETFESLSENQRQTLRMFFVEGYTLDEIAAKLGQSKGNVKHHYFRALDRLRRQLFTGKLTGKRAV